MFKFVATANITNMHIKDDSIGYYYKMMDLRAEGQYNNIMTAHKHPSDRLVPEILEFFIEKFEPQRISFSQGVNYNDTVISFYWYMNEFAVEADADTFNEQAAAFLLGQEFISINKLAHTDQKRTFMYFNGNLTYKFELENFVNYTGGKLCGGNVYISITINSPLQRPLVGEILKLYPSICCPFINSKITKEIKKLPFSSISYGGTWEQYYCWDVEIICTDQTALNSLNKAILDIIIKLGYLFNSETGNSQVYYSNLGNTPSFIYITKQENNILNFRFQPNS